MVKLNRMRWSALLLIIGPLIYFIAEFITASAWTDPPYSYTYNFISNLGVSGPSKLFGQYMLSPLAWLMNTGFVMLGVVLFAGIILIPHLSRKSYITISSLGFLLAIGTTLVGVFHGSGEALLNGTGQYHSMGAFIAFTSGNMIVILLGKLQTQLAISDKMSRILITCGVAGILFMLLYLVAIIGSTENNQIPIIGLIERGAVYPFLISLMTLGFKLLKRE